MNQDQLRNEFIRLTEVKDEQALNDLLTIFEECLFKMFFDNPKKIGDSNPIADAKIVIQMLFTKLCHLQQIVQGFEFHSRDGHKLNRILDPTVVSATIRTVFETVGMFNTIYVLNDNLDKRLIVYNLWAISGLTSRKRFVHSGSSQENLEKAKEEQNYIDSMIAEIEATNCFKGLSQRNRDKIYKNIADKDWRIRFDGNEVKMLNGYQDLIIKAGIKQGIMDQIYSYFSQYSHPSNVAVFQFAEMFSKESPQFYQIATFNIKLLFMLTSVFIADYIKVLPEAKVAFEKLSTIEQCVINFFNKFARDENFLINDALKALE